MYDAAANAFLPPFAMRADAEARRSFAQACTDEGHAFAKSLKDYSLWFVGEFSDLSAALSPVSPPLLVAKAEEFKTVHPSTSFDSNG